MCCYIILAAARAEERDEILREWCACAEENISLLRGGDGGRGGRGVGRGADAGGEENNPGITSFCVFVDSRITGRNSFHP